MCRAVFAGQDREQDMKKIVIALILALIGVYILLSVFSSSDEYTAEKLLYHAARITARIAANPEVVPPGMQKSAERDINLVIRKYPDVKIKWTARFALAEFYIAVKKYDAALSTLNDVSEQCGEDKLLLSRAQFLRGVVYERQDKWPLALAEYTTLKERYAKTPIGIQIPFYIARYYSGKGLSAEAQNTYTEAIPFYKNLASENKNTILGYTASSFLVSVYLNLKQYEAAGATVEEILNDYPPAVTFKDQLRNVDIIFIELLRQPQKAIEILGKMKVRVKDPVTQRQLEQHIEAIKNNYLTKNK